MEIYSQYGIMMEMLRMKTSLMQFRILTSNIALELGVMTVFTKQNLPSGKVVALKIVTVIL